MFDTAKSQNKQYPLSNHKWRTKSVFLWSVRCGDCENTNPQWRACFRSQSLEKHKLLQHKEEKHNNSPQGEKDKERAGKRGGENPSNPIFIPNSLK